MYNFLRVSKSLIIRYSVGIIILAIMVSTLDINIVQAFKAINNYYFFLFAAAVPLLITPAISASRWKVFLKVQGIYEDFFSLVKINFVSFFLGILLPSSTGFDAIRMLLIEQRNKQTPGAGGASVVIERMIGFFLLSFLGIIGGLFVFSYGVSIKVVIASVIVNLCLLLFFIIIKNHFLYFRITESLKRLRKGKQIADYLHLLYTAIKNFPVKRVFFIALPLILLFQLANIFCAFALFKAFDIDISFYNHLAFIPLITIISILPVTISGLGLREGAFVYFYSLVGVNPDISFLISLLYYLIFMVLPAFVGMVIYISKDGNYKITALSLKKES